MFSLKILSLLILCLGICADYITYGLTGNFTLVPDTFHLCNNTKTCFNQVCHLLQDNSFAMIVTDGAGAHFNNSYIRVNMIVFGINLKRIIIKNSSYECNNFIDCVRFGIKKQKHGWIVFAGQCIFE